MATNRRSRSIENDARDQLDAIDESLRARLAQDARLTSGVPEEQRGDDLDFIQMSGLTRPVLSEAPRVAPRTFSDLDPSRPLNFFEAGVADVDASMDPGTLDSAQADSEDVAVVTRPSESAQGLREILAQLASDETGPPLDDSSQPAMTRSIEDGLDPQAMVDAGGADLLRREVGDTPQPPEDELGDSQPSEEVHEFEHLPESRAESEREGEPSNGSDVDGIDSAGEFDPDTYDVGSPEAAIPEAVSEAIAEPAAPIDYEFLHTPSIDDALRQSLVDPADQPLESAVVYDVAADAGGMWQGNRDEHDEAPAPVVVAMPPQLRDDAELGLRRSDAALPSNAVAMSEWEAARRPDANGHLAGDPPSWLLPQEGPLLQNRDQRRRSKSGRRSIRRRIRRWMVRATVAIVLLTSLGAVAWVLRDVYKPPVDLYMEAESMTRDGMYEEASERYEAFAERNPDNPLRAAAQFQAAQVLAHVHPESQDERTAIYRRSLSLYKKFIDENPGHPKMARAARLSAQLQYALGQYDEVVRDYQPELQVQDPTSALPALRLVAGSYAQLGEFEHAESAYLRAASMESNLAPERDYESLADLHQRMGERAETPDARARHLQKALEYLDLAMESPSIDPALRERIHLKRESWQAESVQPVGAAPADEAVATEPVEQPADRSGAPDPGFPAQTDTAPPAEESLNRELDPAVEAKHWEHVTAETAVVDGPATAAPSEAPPVPER